MAHLTARRRNGALMPASALFGLALILFGLCQGPPEQILSGLRIIVTMEDVLITDYIAVAGLGAAFVNAGLVTLISVAILWLLDDTPNGATMVTIGLMSGFALFGKNIANIWPILGGTALYALVQKETLSRHVNVALRTTALSPVVSFMAVRFHPWLGVAAGLLVGFVMPPVAEHAHRVQNGMNLYSLGFSCGLVAMMLVPVFKAFGLNPESALHWSTGNNLLLGTALALLCLLCIGVGLTHRPRRTMEKYWALLRTSGRVPSDYIRTFGRSTVLVNAGVNGLLATGYILITGGDLNGPTVGGILTIMGFSAFGKHALNILPVMAGVAVGSVVMDWSLTDSAVQLACLFCTTLAPIAGYFGWGYGVLAGFLHSSVVLYTGSPVAGMNLYNNGFSGGLIAIVLYPTIMAIARHRKPVLQEEDYFDQLEGDRPVIPPEPHIIQEEE